MTDRLTGAEVREFQGQAIDPPVSNAGEAREYFNTTTNSFRRSVNGGIYRDVFPVEEEYVPRPEVPTANQLTRNAAATLEGGSFILPRSIQLNRVVFAVTAFAGPATGVILLYQEPEGRVTGTLNLVGTVGFTPSVGILSVAPSEGTIVLSDGLFYALWGQDSGGGSFSMRTYSVPSLEMLNSNVPAGLHPVSAVSALDPAAPPATLDPAADLVGGVGADVTPVMRFRTV